MSIKLDPALLKTLASLTIRGKYVAEGYISGSHQSPLKGSSLEFEQHRQYSYGDEIKYMDWKVYGRTDRLYVKQFQEETNLHAYNVLDISKSMEFNSHKISKIEYSALMAAAITYILIRQRDSIGLITFSEMIDNFIPARNYSFHMKRIMDLLGELKSKGSSDYQRSFTDIGKRIKKRNLIFIFSDLWGDSSDLIKSLKYFSSRKNDVVVFHVLDPMEIILEKNGEVEFTDMESGEKLITNTDYILNEYNKKMAEHLEMLNMGLKANLIDYYTIRTDEPIEKSIKRFVNSRKTRKT